MDYVNLSVYYICVLFPLTYILYLKNVSLDCYEDYTGLYKEVWFSKDFGSVVYFLLVVTLDVGKYSLLILWKSLNILLDH